MPVFIYRLPGKKKDPEAPQEPDEPSVEKTQDILPEGEPYTVPELGMQMTWIPAGNFLMGSPPSEPGHRLEEEDLHNVVISRGFWIGTYEVTQKEFTSILDGENPSTFKGPQLPVHKVSWQTAMEFCKALTEREKFAVACLSIGTLSYLLKPNGNMHAALELLMYSILEMTRKL